MLFKGFWIWCKGIKLHEKVLTEVSGIVVDNFRR